MSTETVSSQGGSGHGQSGTESDAKRTDSQTASPRGSVAITDELSHHEDEDITKAEAKDQRPSQSHKRVKGGKSKSITLKKRKPKLHKPKVRVSPQKSSITSTTDEDIYREKSYDECFFDQLGKREWRIFAKLEDVLERQVSCQGKTDRATQVDWKWRIMAERWRHATLIVPTSVKYAPRNPRQELNDLRLVRPGIDKSVDTSTLDFDPGDPNMRYTPVPCVEEIVVVPSVVNRMSVTKNGADVYNEIQINTPDTPAVHVSHSVAEE